MTEQIGFRLQISCDNAAFEDNAAQAIADCLRTVAARIEAGEDCSFYRNIADPNGNVVGSFALKPVNSF
jgi:hypothetical protein